MGKQWKKTLAPWKKSYDEPRQHIKKHSLILLTKVCIVKAIIFPVVIYTCEGWNIKKAKCQRTDAFKLRCWRRLSRVPWIARRSNHSVLSKINPEYSLEELMLKLKLQYFGTWCQEPTHWKIPWCWERSKAGGGDRGWEGWTASPTQRLWIWTNSTW